MTSLSGRRTFAPTVQLARRVDPVLHLLLLSVKDSRTCAASESPSERAREEEREGKRKSKMSVLVHETKPQRAIARARVRERGERERGARERRERGERETERESKELQNTKG